MSYRLLVLVLAMLAGCNNGCGAGVRPPDRRQSTGEWQYSVTLRLQVTCADGSVWYGSGVAVSPRTAITAYHVVDCAAPAVRVATHDGRVLNAHLDKSDAKNDVARVRLDTGETFRAWALPSPSPMRLDETVCSVGGDMVVSFLKKCGAVYQYDEDNGIIFASVQTVAGNSGGRCSVAGTSWESSCAVAVTHLRRRSGLPCTRACGFAWRWRDSHDQRGRIRSLRVD